MDNIKKNSDAKIKANNKYKNSHYKRLAIDVKPDVAEKIKDHAEENNQSVASFIVQACNYVIDNNINLNDDKS